VLSNKNSYVPNSRIISLKYIVIFLQFGILKLTFGVICGNVCSVQTSEPLRIRQDQVPFKMHRTWSAVGSRVGSSFQ
jgi:hypothetical protein